MPARGSAPGDGRARRRHRHAVLLVRAALALLLLFGIQPARAICLRGPTPDLTRLDDLVGKDPQVALDGATARLAAIAGRGGSREQIGWLRAIQADAYDNLSLPEEARRAALAGMAAVPDIRDPAYVEALNEYAYNGFDDAQIDRSIPLIERARAAQRPGSAADVCLQATLGHLLRMRDQSDQAMVSLMRAYRASLRPGLEEQRAYVAAAFSILMRYATDYGQALALNQEGIDWSIAKGRTHDLADYRFKGGWILVQQGRYEAALEQFRLARALRKPFHDVVNDAYLDLLTCQALVELGRIAPAKTSCIRAERIFAAHQDASRGQARLLLARIALAEGHPARALDLLSILLRDGDARSASVSTARVYKYRAEALLALGRASEAYADLDRFVVLKARWNQTEGARQAALLRTRFQTDRQIDRNRELQSALGFARERAREQWRRTLILLGAGCVCILLLGYIVLTDRRNRRHLLLVASSDALTGLLNRKWSADRAAEILDQPPRDGHPLSAALIDLDHFKAINDTHGHAAGDEVLRQFAAAARKITRDTDVLGRWGGEEFLLIMPDTPISGAIEALERLRALAAGVELPFADDLTIRFSAGVALRGSERSLDLLVARADIALYRAKARGRNATCIDGIDTDATPRPIGDATRAHARRTSPDALVIET